MTINDVLSLKAARLDAIADLKSFWGPEHQRWFHLHSLYGAALFDWHQRHLSSSVFRSLRSVIYPYAKPDNEVDSRSYEGWVKLRSYFNPFVDESLRNLETMYVGDPYSYQRTYPIVYIMLHSEDIPVELVFRPPDIVVGGLLLYYGFFFFFFLFFVV